MKKTLLFGLALLGSVCAFAQSEGTDVTPAGYKFSQISEIPWFDNGYGSPGYGFINVANYVTSSRTGKGVWLNLGSSAQEYWDANNGLMGCAFVADEETMGQILEGFQIADLGGEVGKVLCWQGVSSNLKDCLEENYPEADWSNLPDKLSSGLKQSFNLNFWLNPKDIWTKGMGYYRVRLVVNACHHATEDDINNGIYDFSGENVIKEMYQVNDQGNNTSFIYDGTVNEEGQKVNKGNSDVGVLAPITNDLFVKRTANGTIIPNREGDPMWDPTKWAIVDYYFNVAGDDKGLDENGDTTIPVRIKLGMGEKLNNLAILIKEFSITKFDGDLTEEIYDKNKEPYPLTVITPVVGDAGVEGIIDDSNAPIEYFNLQGMKVANPEKGIFIKKQGKKSTKVIL
ncbi:MAG: hypothetical protein J1E16_04570 [Muribaculaceae bacterium]|nr:hypothetical protein [Muribaculaceae bacterium]